MAEAKTYFADTTVVYYRLHGHSLQSEAVRDAVGSDRMVVTNFVRGEYIRGYVAGLIDLYSAIKEEKSVEDGIHVFTSDAGGRPRKIANALNTVARSLMGYEDWRDVHKTLRRLGEDIRARLLCFDAIFLNRVRDPLACEIGVMSFPQESFDEKHIFDFYEELEKTREEPGCDQCAFRRDQIATLTAAGIDLYGTVQQTKHKDYKGYLGQAEWMDKAARSTKTEPSCWYCDRLGDTIIALSAPNDATLLTGDKQSFPVLAEILGTPIKLIPSLAELREKRDAT